MSFGIDISRLMGKNKKGKKREEQVAEKRLSCSLCYYLLLNTVPSKSGCFLFNAISVV